MKERSMFSRVPLGCIEIELLMLSPGALHGQTTSAPLTLYMPDGQLASHSIRIYVTHDIPATAKPKLQLFGDNAVIKAPQVVVGRAEINVGSALWAGFCSSRPAASGFSATRRSSKRLRGEPAWQSRRSPPGTSRSSQNPGIQPGGISGAEAGPVG
jgi:hypothetical protein